MSIRWMKDVFFLLFFFCIVCKAVLKEIGSSWFGKFLAIVSFALF